MPKKEKITWQNRIVGMGEKPAKDFISNPLNWRTHPEFQRQTLDAVLSEVGWVTGVIVNRATGYLLDGHARIEQAMAKNPDELVPFIEVELSEDEERKILAVLDPIGAMATTDDEKLRELAQVLNFESDALNQLMAQKEIAEINIEDFFQQNPNAEVTGKFIVELEFSSESEQAEVLKNLAEIAGTPAAAVKKLLDL